MTHRKQGLCCVSMCSLMCSCVFVNIYFLCLHRSQLKWCVHLSTSYSLNATKKKQLSLHLPRWKQSKLNRVMIIVAAIIILLWANQWTELAAAVSLCRMCWQRVVIHPQWTSKTGAQPNMMRKQKEKRLFHTRRRLGCEIISYRTQ